MVLIKKINLVMLISVCIPTYNRPEHLKNCLNSLVLQTDKKFEVCISDNCSKTNTKKIIIKVLGTNIFSLQAFS